ncbi:MAG: transcriptional regulator MntR [Limnochordales bacterium]
MTAQKPTPSIEDYLERIYELVEEKGYARVSDIASSLDVQPSSVTRMVQRLDDQEYLIYERYRGLTLTPKGKELGRRIKERHELLEDFLRLLGVNEADVQRDVEGIEHHVSPGTVSAIEHLVRFLQSHPEWRVRFLEYRAQQRAREARAEQGPEAAEAREAAEAAEALGPVEAAEVHEAAKDSE